MENRSSPQLFLAICMFAILLMVSLSAYALEAPQFSIHNPNGIPCDTAQTAMTVTDNADLRSVTVYLIPENAAGAIMWSPSEDAAYYRYAIRNIDTNSVDVPDTSTDNTSVSIANLRRGVVYKLAVGTIDADENQLWNDIFFMIEFASTQMDQGGTATYSEHSQVMEAPGSTHDGPSPATARQAVVYGEFYQRSMTLAIGEVQQVEGIALIENGSLDRVTLTIPGYFGDDPNNRYATVQVQDGTSLSLGMYQEFVVDTRRAPFNVPGQYTLCLNVKTTDEVWGVVDEIPVTVLPLESMNPNAEADAMHSDLVPPYDRPSPNAESSGDLIISYSYDTESNAFDENILFPVITFPKDGSPLGNISSVTIQWTMPNATVFETEFHNYELTRDAVTLVEDGVPISSANTEDITLDSSGTRASHTFTGLTPGHDYKVVVSTQWLKSNVNDIWDYEMLEPSSTVFFSTSEKSYNPENGLNAYIGIPEIISTLPIVTLISPTTDDTFITGDSVLIQGTAENFSYGEVHVLNMETLDDDSIEFTEGDFSFEYSLEQAGKYQISVVASDLPGTIDLPANRAVAVAQVTAMSTSVYTPVSDLTASVPTHSTSLALPSVALSSPSDKELYFTGNSITIQGIAENFSYGEIHVLNIETINEDSLDFSENYFSFEYLLEDAGEYQISVIVSDLPETIDDPSANRAISATKISVRNLIIENDTKITGAFAERNLTLTLGESYRPNGYAMVENGLLAQVTYQIEGHFGDDPNNRYATTAVDGRTNHLNLDEADDLVIDTTREPLNNPGQYNLRLVVRATDGKWTVVDEIPVTVLAQQADTSVHPITPTRPVITLPYQHDMLENTSGARVQWTGGDGAERFVVALTDENTGEHLLWHEDSTASTYHDVSGLQKGHSYFFELGAVPANAESGSEFVAWAEGLYIHVLDDDAPTFPFTGYIQKERATTYSKPHESFAMPSSFYVDYKDAVTVHGIINDFYKITFPLSAGGTVTRFVAVEDVGLMRFDPCANGHNYGSDIRYEEAHPHKEFRRCARCNATEYTNTYRTANGSTKVELKNETCCLCGNHLWDNTGEKCIKCMIKNPLYQSQPASPTSTFSPCVHDYNVTLGMHPHTEAIKTCTLCGDIQKTALSGPVRDPDCQACNIGSGLLINPAEHPQKNYPFAQGGVWKAAIGTEIEGTHLAPVPYLQIYLKPEDVALISFYMHELMKDEAMNFAWKSTKQVFSLIMDFGFFKDMTDSAQTLSNAKDVYDSIDMNTDLANDILGVLSQKPDKKSAEAMAAALLGMTDPTAFEAVGNYAGALVDLFCNTCFGKIFYTLDALSILDQTLLMNRLDTYVRKNQGVVLSYTWEDSFVADVFSYTPIFKRVIKDQPVILPWLIYPNVSSNDVAGTFFGSDGKFYVDWR